MASAPIDFMVPLMQRQRAVGLQIGTDVKDLPPGLWQLFVLQALTTSIVMKAIQDLSPTLATDAAWDERIGPDALATTAANPSWDPIVSRTVFED